MKIFQMKYRKFPGRKLWPIQNRAIRSVQSPILVHDHLKLDCMLQQQDTSQQIKERMAKLIAKEQLTRNLVVAIDVTCPSEQISTKIAEQLANSIISTLDQYYPELRDRFVGISDNEACLPLHNLMCTGKLAWEEIDNQHLFVFE